MNLITLTYSQVSIMKCLVFTAESTYARFRRPCTTTSALTFSVIHPIAVKGMVAALMGVGYEDYYKYISNMKIAIQVINPVYKDMQSFNLIAQASNNNAPSFQSRVEFLRDVKYRLFILDNEDKLVNIKHTMENHNYIFTPYLGCSEHIANIKFEGIYEVKKIEDRFVNTVVPKENVEIDESGDIIIYADRIPIRNNENREYIEYTKVLFSNNMLFINESSAYKVGEYNVFFF